MKKNLFYLVLALVMMSAASVNAQVLIGGAASDEPHAGSILDLASGGQTNMGLLLPNVELNDDASEFVLVPGGTVTEDIKQTATGMIVYNTAYVLKGAGVYVWDGNKWMPLRDPCQNSILDKRDGNVYCTGDFGAAGWWMTQNLRYIPTDPGYAYPNQDNTILDPGKHPEYGLLYTWDAAANGETVEPMHGICPDGWHIPDVNEWDALRAEISNDASNKYSTFSGTGDAGTKMKSAVFVNGTDSQGSSHPAQRGGFDALLAGWEYEGDVRDYGSATGFWAADWDGRGNWGYSLAASGSSSSMLGKFRKDSRTLHSMRCKRDN
jgi:uncharacterized protein (TIGR02145 family)